MIQRILHLVTLCCLLTCPLISHGQTEYIPDKSNTRNIDPRDTFKFPKSEYKMNRKEFLAKYGTDDSSRALIDVVFNDRLLGYCTLPAYPVLILGPGFLVKKYKDNNWTYTGEYATQGLVAGIATLSGAYFIVSNTRKKLRKELKFYEQFGYLSEDYHILVKQKLFRRDRKKRKL